MENLFKPLRHQHVSESLTTRSSVLKYFKSLNKSEDEEKRQLKYNDDLSKMISVADQQTDSDATKVMKVRDEKKKISQKNLELNRKVTRDTSKAADLKAEIEKEQAKKEEEERLAKNLQSKVDLLLQPYHDVLGVQFQHSKEPEHSLRMIFQMPNSKKCVVKIARNPIKIVKCVPMLEGLDKLEAQLAETNDFHGFVTHLRSLFLNGTLTTMNKN